MEAVDLNEFVETLRQRGYAVVPLTPTAEMIEAMCFFSDDQPFDPTDLDNAITDYKKHVAASYRAALSVAPKPEWRQAVPGAAAVTICWRTREDLPGDYVRGEVLAKVYHGGSDVAHEVIPFAFSREAIEWRERNSRNWRLVAWIPLAEVLQAIDGATAAQPAPGVA